MKWEAFRDRFRVLFKDWRGAEIAGFAVGIIALVVGLVHLFELDDAMDKVQTVQGSVSTRYVGSFPSFVDKIESVVSSANERITIFCDFPGYAGFSDPKGALKYRQAIDRKRVDGVQIELTCMDRERRRNYLKDFFPKDEWTAWTADPEKRAKVARYLQSRNSGPIRTREELLARMEQEDEEVLRQIFPNARQIAEKMPIYFWIADDRTAFFAISALSDEVSEYGFMTSDPTLIKALRELSDRYRRPGPEKN